MITTIVEIEPRMMFLIFWRLLIFEKTVVNFLFYILYVGCTWQWHPLDSSTVHTHLSKLIYVLNKNHLVLVNIFHTVYQEKKKIHTYMVFVGSTWHTIGFQHTHLSKLIYELVPKVFKASFLIYWELTKAWEMSD